MAEKIKLLFLAANPIEVSRLRLGEEFRLIEREIRSSPTRYLIETMAAWAVKPEDLFDLLLIHSPTIIHISGHATKAKGIVLENAAGKMSPVSAEALAEVFRPFSNTVRMIFLNMCYTQTYVNELAPFIDCVVGVKTKINDKGAITLSTSFYKALAWGFPAQIAFQIATGQLMLRRNRYSGSPILRMRDQYSSIILQDIALNASENSIPTRSLVQSVDIVQPQDQDALSSQDKEIVELRREVAELRKDLSQLLRVFAQRFEEN